LSFLQPSGTTQHNTSPTYRSTFSFFSSIIPLLIFDVETSFDYVIIFFDVSRYGKDGIGTIPGDQVLVFRVTLVGAKERK
jgi:hypothetical protein